MDHSPTRRRTGSPDPFDVLERNLRNEDFSIQKKRLEQQRVREYFDSLDKNTRLFPSENYPPMRQETLLPSHSPMSSPKVAGTRSHDLLYQKYYPSNQASNNTLPQ